jgi:hypothetical protein
VILVWHYEAKSGTTAAPYIPEVALYSCSTVVVLSSRNEKRQRLNLPCRKACLPQSISRAEPFDGCCWIITGASCSKMCLQQRPIAALLCIVLISTGVTLSGAGPSPIVDFFPSALATGLPMLCLVSTGPNHSPAAAPRLAAAPSLICAQPMPRTRPPSLAQCVSHCKLYL